MSKPHKDIFVMINQLRMFSRFIKLSSVIINTNHIVKISTRKPDKYTIYLRDDEVSGIMLFTSGVLDTTPHTIEVCKTNDPADFYKLTEWIDKIE